MNRGDTKAKITYADKSTLNEQPSIASENKVTSSDMNEIKNVVNGLIVDSYNESTENTYSCDYINDNFTIEIESGTDTNYNKKRSIKFSNGFMINTIEEYHTDNLTQNGSVYQSPAHVSDWLTPFTELYSINGGISESNRYISLLEYRPSNSNKLLQTPTHTIITYSSGTTNYRTSYVAFGKWK